MIGKVYWQSFQVTLLRLVLIAACLWWYPFTTQAAESSATVSKSSQRPRIGLVLSGGGARGAAHIGVIKVLEDMNIPIDCIAGTSMGAIVGGLYAAGLSVDELEKALTSIPWNEAFIDAPPRELKSFRRKRDDDNFLVKAKPGFKEGRVALPRGAIQGQKLNLILRKLALPAANVHDFDQLKISYRAVATDIGTGTPVALGSGDLATAMRASMSIPSVLAPIEIDGKLLVDGGVSNNLPMDVARQTCADVLIVVSIGTPLEPTEKLTSVLSITGQLTTIMTQQNTQQQLRTLKSGDILIEPDLGDITTAAFDRAAEAIPIGAKAAHTKQSELQRLVVPPASYQTYRAARLRPEASAPVIDFIRIENNSRLSDRVLKSRLHIKPGDRIDVAALEKDLAVIYGLDNFERVDYSLVQENGKTGLVVKAVAKQWGPNYLQLGLNLQANFDGNSAFNIGLGYLKTEINSLGGEWRILAELGNDLRFFTDFYQPLTPDYRYFIVPAASYEAFDAGFFTADRANAGFRIKRTRIDLAGGLNLGDGGELRLGLRWATGEIQFKASDPPLPDQPFDDGGYLVRLSTDILDNINFPRQGSLTRLEYYQSLKAIGADSNFSTLSFAGVWPQTWGKHTLLPGLRVAGKLTGDLAIQNQFYLGGFLNLSGFQSNALAGQYSGLAELIYYYRLDDASAAFTLPIYAGGSLEVGNVWQATDDISLKSLITAGSLFLGLDTPIGPFYLGGGLAEGGNKSMYMFLGRTF
jgi:NTE family protein